MITKFYIDCSIKTVEGHIRFGRFNIGENKEEAYELFQRLKGSHECDDRDILFIEFMEMANGLPVNHDMLTCGLQEIGINCMLITQEVFRLMHLRRRL
jgi:hypothetical protein